jgi:hypothetical protein
MSSIEAYLDRVCGNLHVNPAVAADLRDEFRAHLEELAESYRAAGATAEEAYQRAIARFGAAARLCVSLEEVHREEPGWLQCHKGLAAGMLAGCLLTVPLLVLMRLGLAASLFAALLVLPSPALGLALNGLVVGGLIGLVSRAHGGVFIGWILGSLIWLVEYLCCWVLGTTSSAFSPELSLAMLNSMLLAPVVGGADGAAAGLASTFLLTLTSRLRGEAG